MNQLLRKINKMHCGGCVAKIEAALDTGSGQLAWSILGLLTLGKPEVTDINAFQGSENHLLRLAASLETGSEHPLAASILQAAEKKGLKTDSVKSINHEFLIANK